VGFAQAESCRQFPVSAGKDAEMSKDKILEWLLWEKEIYPPSVLDSHYYDTPEMSRCEIVLKTLWEMGVLLPLGQYAQSSVRNVESDFGTLQKGGCG